MAVDVDGPIRLIREAAALRAVLYQYATAYERFMAQARAYRDKGNWMAAAGARLQALAVIEAYERELNDPEPKA